MHKCFTTIATGLLALGAAIAPCLAAGPAQDGDRAAEQRIVKALSTKEGTYVSRDFKFHTGEVAPRLKLHYTTLGTPHRGPDGKVDNAVLILHGTGGTGHQFMSPVYAGELFGPGQPLDAGKYYIILPDDIGHGQSSKPSDGLRMAFPKYDYADMVRGEYLLVTQGLGVDHLRLVTGTSMGCMHSFMWGEQYPGFMDALMPLACLPTAIGGRNRLWRDMVLNAIRDDPAWRGGNYRDPPLAGLKTVARILLLAGGAPQVMQVKMPKGSDVDSYLARVVPRIASRLDANDVLYQFDASRDYDPSARLGTIKAPLTWINSEDDFINPPILGVTKTYAAEIPHGRFVLIPASQSTHGHGTHTFAAIWKRYLVQLLDESAKH
jgi:homoserine O-acetyltransferase